MDFGKVFSEYGLAGLVIGTLFFMFWRWSVWIMGWIKDRDKQTADERIAWLCRLEKINDATNKISDSIDDHDKRANERGSHVSAEHEKMISNLNEMGKALARINGYKE